jgi:AcrR family transcriptional regulator
MENSTAIAGEGRHDQHEAKRLAILRAAARIFTERGYHTTSVAEVAEALGVSKPFLYYYLKNKEDILFACSRIATEQLQEVLEQVRNAPGTGWEKLRMLFRGYARVMTTDFGICLLRSTTPGSLPREMRERLYAGRRRLNTEVERLVAQGIADGSIRSLHPRMASFALFGAFNWISNWYRPEGPMPPEGIADVFLDLFARGMAPAHDDRSGGADAYP